MKFNENYYFDLIENKNFPSNQLFKYAFNILQNSNKDNNISQNNNSMNTNNNINNNQNNRINQNIIPNGYYNTSINNNGFKNNIDNNINNNGNNNNFKNNFQNYNNNNFQNYNNNNFQNYNNNDFQNNNNNNFQNNNNNNFQNNNNINNSYYNNNNQINGIQNNINNNSNVNNNNNFPNNNNNVCQNNNLNNQNNTSNNNIDQNNYYFPLKGLRNIGSTCYMNATLQCLLHSNELFAYFLNEYPKDCVNLKDKNKHVESQGDLSRAFYNIIKGIHQNNNNISNPMNPSTNIFSHFNRFNFFNNSKAFSPDQFKKVLGYYNSQFRKFEANDSKDLILYLLQTMHEELNYFGENYSLPYKGSPNQYNEQNTFIYFMNSYNMRNFSIISNIFYGTYENIIQCQKCKKNIFIFQKICLK